MPEGYGAEERRPGHEGDADSDCQDAAEVRAAPRRDRERNLPPGPDPRVALRDGVPARDVVAAPL